MINALIMDVDGTLTDGKVYIGNNGEAFKAYNIKDGYGIANILPLHGIIPVIITGRQSESVNIRACELGITNVFQGIKDKKALLEKWINDQSESKEYTIAYIGDDDNDLQCMEYVRNISGIIGCPSDASQKIISTADFVCKNKGGDGAVREFIDYLISL